VDAAVDTNTGVPHTVTTARDVSNAYHPNKGPEASIPPTMKVYSGTSEEEHKF